MELLILVLVAIGAIETTYLVYKANPRTTVDTHSLLLDTSVLIDGRILPIARSGLITAPLIIPRSVVRELQYMADKADHDKRERAREGLDMIDQLQHIENVTVRLIDDPELTDGGVDERLVELAQQSNARLCTIDYNLNKAARVQGVVVVNINELAHALRIVHLPGEKVELKLVQPGQESRQAVGYLDDGTMVVVDDAKGLIGHSVQVEVTRVLQTTAGKMMFAKKVSSAAQKPSQKNSNRNSSARTSKKFSLQTASNASMVTDNEARNNPGQTTSEAGMVASEETTGKANIARSEKPSPNEALATSMQNEANAVTNVEPQSDSQQSPATNSNITQQTSRPKRSAQPRSNNSTNTPQSEPRTPAQGASTPNNVTPPPSGQRRPKYQNQRRRRSPEDSLLDELTKQQ